MAASATGGILTLFSYQWHHDVGLHWPPLASLLHARAMHIAHHCWPLLTLPESALMTVLNNVCTVLFTLTLSAYWDLPNCVPLKLLLAGMSMYGSGIRATT